MNTLKSNDDTLDRLSELPDSLIHEILSFLGMRDVVRTTLLSKRWKYLWTTIPCLRFNEHRNDSVQIRNFVNRVLAIWRGPHLRKFSISFSSDSKAMASLFSDLDLWVQFANERKVEDLCICLHSYGPLYCPPQCLYECSSIRKILLIGCDLQTDGNVQWDRLISFKLSECRISEDVINKILSSSLQLENLWLYGHQHCKNLSIRSSSVKRLVINSTIYDRQSVYCSNNYESSVLTIWAPNLKEFFYLGMPYRTSLLEDVSSLTDLHLDFLGKRPVVDGEALRQILPAINHVVSVVLSDSCFEMLEVIKRTDSFSPLSNVKLLRIGSGLIELSKLVNLFEIFPKLKMLIVNWRCGRQQFEFNADNYIMNIMSEANSLKSNLLQLRTVEITWSSYYPSIFQFIEFLLTHATMLEKMVIERRVLKVVESDDMFLATQKVVSLQRFFPSVELILYQQIVKF